MNYLSHIYAMTIRVIVIFLIVSFSAAAQDLTDKISLNQIGFYPNGPKTLIVEGVQTDSFYVMNTKTKEKVFKGRLNKGSNTSSMVGDFSPLSEVGEYIAGVPGLGVSYSFKIQPDVFQELLKGAIKGFYFQRMSAELSEEYAGKWKRAAGHPDNKVLIHPSVGQLKSGKKLISAPGGWYDAGDYNKYIVNSGITMGTLLSLYEEFPEYFDTLSIRIPEHDNQISDLLDEVLWNLRWMLKMQDQDDGGVYHKLTNPDFYGAEMPEKATKPRYVVQKSTAATLDFSAVTAQAARIFRQFSKTLPGLSDSCLSASKKAWGWTEKNPDIIYDQDRINKNFDPDITTGTYGDKNLDDEWFWAASELYVTTHSDKYLNVLRAKLNEDMQLPSWSDVEGLGYYSLLRNKMNLPEESEAELKRIRKIVIEFAEGLISGQLPAPYQVFGKSEKDFIWGSNAVAANQGIALIQAYFITKDKKYFKHALGNLDYLLGRNPTGYSFVTGFGDKTPMHPHHRPSEADGVEDPVPGLLVGGPNAGRQDKCDYPFSVPAKSYVDSYCSYASNEIAINWNAPLVYLVAALEILN